MTSSNTQSPLDAIANAALSLDAAASSEAPVQAADTPDGAAFAALGLSPEIVSGLIAAGYKAPTPVQERAIPAGIAGRDLLVSRRSRRPRPPSRASRARKAPTARNAIAASAVRSPWRAPASSSSRPRASSPCR